ncbi:MAG: hypothetical protein Tsb005_01600 [Gammaproteobacteria bacterium]
MKTCYFSKSKVAAFSAGCLLAILSGTASAEIHFLNSKREASATTPNNAISPTDLTMEQRVSRLEQQFDYLEKSNLLEQLTQAQQEIQQLQGKLEEQAHEIKTMSSIQHQVFQDLDQRVNELAQNTTPTANKNNVAQPKPSNSVSSLINSEVPQQIRVSALSSSNKEAAEKTTEQPDKDAKLPSAESVAVEQARYTAAFALIKQKQFVAAMNAMKNFIRDYPQSQYSANAHYWLGELYLAQQQKQLAANEFNIVIQQFPLSSKVADAHLKLGFLYADNQQIQQARQQLQLVQQQFPDTVSARLATAKLSQLK